MLHEPNGGSTHTHTEEGSGCKRVTKCDALSKFEQTPDRNLLNFMHPWLSGKRAEIKRTTERRNVRTTPVRKRVAKYGKGKARKKERKRPCEKKIEAALQSKIYKNKTRQQGFRWQAPKRAFSTPAAAPRKRPVPAP
jgi:hypothetical protein